jgi:hypothetical protein
VFGEGCPWTQIFPTRTTGRRHFVSEFVNRNSLVREHHSASDKQLTIFVTCGGHLAADVVGDYPYALDTITVSAESESDARDGRSIHSAINMLGLAKRVKAEILQASTSEIYGNPTIHPQPENY